MTHGKTERQAERPYRLVDVLDGEVEETLDSLR